VKPLTAQHTAVPPCGYPSLCQRCDPAQSQAHFVAVTAGAAGAGWCLRCAAAAAAAAGWCLRYAAAPPGHRAAAAGVCAHRAGAVAPPGFGGLDSLMCGET